MHQHVAHIYNISPRNFRMFLSKLLCEQISSLANNHNIVNHSMVAHNVSLHFFEILPSQKIIHTVDTFRDMTKTIYISNAFSHISSFFLD